MRSKPQETQASSPQNMVSKKTKKVVIEQEDVAEEMAEVKVESARLEVLAKLEVDFGREDLNSLRNKVNELVDAVNSK